MRQQFFNLEQLWSAGVIPSGQRIPVLTEETDAGVWISIIPMGAPRQTQRDKWAKRPVVQRYRLYSDILKAADQRHNISGIIKQMGYVVGAKFVMPIPQSWSAKKKKMVDGMPHTAASIQKQQQTKPDTDNIVKGILDSLFNDDSHIWAPLCFKVYGSSPGIMVFKNTSELLYEFNKALHQLQLQGGQVHSQDTAKQHGT